MKAEQVFLGLGSNLGDRGKILAEVLQELSSFFDEFRGASFYETEPLHVKDQGRFLNTVASGLYAGAPEELLALIQNIEQAHGRDRSRERRWGERTLDIDILLFGKRIHSGAPALEIPHPRLRERAFALIPLLELAPDAEEPGTGQPYRAILDALPDQGVRCLGSYV